MLLISKKRNADSKRKKLKKNAKKGKKKRLQDSKKKRKCDANENETAVAAETVARAQNMIRIMRGVAEGDTMRISVKEIPAMMIIGEVIEWMASMMIAVNVTATISITQDMVFMMISIEEHKTTNMKEGTDISMRGDSDQDQDSQDLQTEREDRSLWNDAERNMIEDWAGELVLI